MIDYRSEGYTAHFREPLPDGLSPEHLFEALAQVGPKYEENLPGALAELTGRRFLVETDPRTWVIEADRRISEETFTITAVEG